jgi:uncharacterized damage-inducible protein DinB
MEWWDLKTPSFLFPPLLQYSITPLLPWYEQVTTPWKDETLQVVDDLYGQKWKRGATLLSLIKHEVHHRGQMTVLMRQAGLKVPGIYGPSKEEWPQYGMKEPGI